MNRRIQLQRLTKPRIKAVIAAVGPLLVFSASAPAAVLEMDGLHAIGVQHFRFEGVSYSIHFDARSFNEILADPSYSNPFPFLENGFDTVEPIITGLNGLLMDAGATRLRDPESAEGVFRGIIPTREISAARPADFVGRENQFLGGIWKIPVGGGGAGFERHQSAAQHNRVFMVFAPVPEPASVAWVAGLGLLALAAGRKLAPVRGGNQTGQEQTKARFQERPQIENK